MKEQLTLILATIALWGLWGFFSKIASTKIGIQTSFFSAVVLFILITTYLLASNHLIPIKTDSTGIFFAILAGVASGAASILFYILIGKNPAGFVIATTALYPIVTLLLSAIFLKEAVTPIKSIGFVLAVIALVLLNL